MIVWLYIADFVLFYAALRLINIMNSFQWKGREDIALLGSLIALAITRTKWCRSLLDFFSFAPFIAPTYTEWWLIIVDNGKWLLVDTACNMRQTYFS